MSPVGETREWVWLIMLNSTNSGLDVACTSSFYQLGENYPNANPDTLWSARYELIRALSADM